MEPQIIPWNPTGGCIRTVGAVGVDHGRADRDGASRCSPSCLKGTMKEKVGEMYSLVYLQYNLDNALTLSHPSWALVWGVYAFASKPST